MVDAAISISELGALGKPVSDKTPSKGKMKDLSV